jgi:hypothetical protein
VKTKRRKRIVYRSKKTTTRVTVDFPKSLHRKLKALAALKGITLQEYIRSRVSAKSENEDISDTELKPLVKKLIKDNEDALKRLADK